MTLPVPLNELRRRGFSNEAINWFESIQRSMTQFEDTLSFNEDILMPIASVPIDTDFITGVTSSEQTVFTARSGSITILKRIVLCNTHSGALTFSAWLLPSGETLADDHLVIDELSIAASATVIPDGLVNRLMTPGTALIVKASTASKITLGGHYVQRLQGQ